MVENAAKRKQLSNGHPQLLKRKIVKHYVPKTNLIAFKKYQTYLYHCFQHFVIFILCAETPERVIFASKCEIWFKKR